MRMLCRHHTYIIQSRCIAVSVVVFAQYIEDENALVELKLKLLLLLY